VYSFWQPPDSGFIEMLVGLGRRSNAEFCTLFWMKYLYGYIDYNSRTRNLAPQQLINRSEAAAGRRILKNRLNQGKSVWNAFSALWMNKFFTPISSRRKCFQSGKKTLLDLTGYYLFAVCRDLSLVCQQRCPG
jgi:hypothetical protein